MNTLKFLYSLEGRSYNLNLVAIKRLLKKLGNPEKSLKVIHVAGTNGKGSTCAMISSILRQAGYKVGMYTSPHLVNFNERIQINSKKISDDDLEKYFLKVKAVYNDETFFELVTALAFLYFKEKKVDYLVLEVGLGGRLDATNVVIPLVSVITNIGLEHQHYLGNTVKKIAFEKAGIIKKHVPVVTAAQNGALEVIKTVAKKNKSRLYLAHKTKKINVSLKGEFQQYNALLALQVIKILNIGITKAQISAGLKNVRWPGRLEFISKKLLIDCAHNLDAVKVLKKELLKIRSRYDKIILVIGILSDKNYSSMLNELETIADVIVLTKPRTKRAVYPKKLSEFIKNKKVVIKVPVKTALNYAAKISGKNDLILVTGSIYTVGEIFGRI